MKSKQSGQCSFFIVVLLSIMQLSSTLPTIKKDPVSENVCYPIQATELNNKNLIIQAPLVKSLVGVDDGSKVFRLSFSLKDKESTNFIEGGQVCEQSGSGNGIWVGPRVIVHSEHSSERMQRALPFSPVFLITPPTYTWSEDTLLKVTCGQAAMCLNLTFTEGTKFQHQRLSRRAAPNHMTSGERSSVSGEGGIQIKTIVGGVVVTAIGLLVLVSVIALCGGSKTYEPSSTSAIDPPESQVTVTVSAEVSTKQVEEPATQKQNGDISKDQEPSQNQEPFTSKQSPETKRQSLSPPPAPPSNPEEKEQRARSLSSRSFDPLPEIPKLDLAEELPAKKLVEDDKEADDKEDPYSYARVPKAEGVPESDSSDEEATGSPKDVKRPANFVAPYGKVISIDKGNQTSVGDGEYAEVVGEESRARSVTAPVDPSEVGVLRDTRAFTESAAHLPLPAIPKPRPTIEEDSEMYDSIPETMSGREAKPAKVKKERLYESMDEVADENEDMYESVPEELKPDSPVVLTPTSPERPLSISSPPPRPPESPIPTHHHYHPLTSEPKPDESQGKGKKVHKKAIEKTLSATDQAERQKRSFSLFGRVKTKSVSAGVGKTRKKESQSSKPHQGEPLPDIPPQASPSHALSSPSLPPSRPFEVNVEDEDMYDKPLLPQNRTRTGSESETASSSSPLIHTTEEAKVRSKTLPSGPRSPAFKFNQGMPLPEVPEDSGQGMITVTHTRLLEPGSEKSKPYDIVHISPPPVVDDDEEPNYDTVRPELVLNPSLEVRADPDPGYDKVGIRLEGGDEEAPVLDDDKKGTEEPSSPAPVEEVKITALKGASSQEDSLGPVPEHDEVGYARVPEMYLMRKRAMSASQGVRPKPKSPEPQKTSADDGDVKKQAASPEEMYAVIDKTAKKSKDKKEDLEPLSPAERELDSSSPVPPPVPPAVDLGDLSEFSQPPIPERSEDADQLMVDVENDSGYSRVLKVGASDNLDPPYAKVKSKVEHPYAELNIGSVDKPDLESPDAGAFSTSPVPNEEPSGGDTVGESGTTPEVKPATPENMSPDNGESMYDTLASTSSPCEMTVEVSSPDEEEVVVQSTYDTLAPVVQNGSVEEVENEGPYEEIDENTRQNLQKLHHAHTKPA